MPEDKEEVQDTTETPKDTTETSKIPLSVEALRQLLNPTGLDPDLEIKAEELAKRDWQMSFKPVLENIGLLQDLELVVKIQNEIFRTKYKYLEEKEIKDAKAKENGLRWAM